MMNAIFDSYYCFQFSHLLFSYLKLIECVQKTRLNLRNSDYKSDYIFGILTDEMAFDSISMNFSFSQQKELFGSKAKTIQHQFNRSSRNLNVLSSRKLSLLSI